MLPIDIIAIVYIHSNEKIKLLKAFPNLVNIVPKCTYCRNVANYILRFKQRIKYCHLCEDCADNNIDHLDKLLCNYNCNYFANKDIIKRYKENILVIYSDECPKCNLQMRFNINIIQMLDY